jgi:hypothetical protein
MTSRLRAYWQFLSGLPTYLRRPISYEDARATILRRMELRSENFLGMARRCIYENPGSPYLPLLRAAGCEYGDMVSILAQHELEFLLNRLRESGVRISFEEFKGRKPITRNGNSYPVREEHFDNPLLLGGFELRTGGSSGRPSRMLIDLEHLAARSPYEHLLFRVLDLHQVPLALWYPKLPVSIGLSNSLRYAKIGKPPVCWFDMKLAGRALPAWHSWAFSLIVAVSRLCAVPLPWPRVAPLNDPGIVVDWMAGAVRLRGRCAVQSNVSGIVRLCRAASARGIDLCGVQFITGSEPLTPSKRAEIEATHARVFLRYQAVDLGSIASGCGAPEETDECHLLSDAVALITPEAETLQNGSRPLFFTSILGQGPKVVLNVEFGDQAIIRQRQCGCLYEEIGFHTHLSHIRSAVRSTAEGIALPYADLIRISEEILPRLFGGSVLDYQWVEDEEQEAGSLTRVWLRIGPRLGVLDEDSVIRVVLDEIGKPDGARRFYAQIWGNAQTVRILRENPRTTPSGKTPAMLQGRDAGIAVAQAAAP